MGIVLQVYGPFLVVFVLYLRRYPQLCLLTIVGCAGEVIDDLCL